MAQNSSFDVTTGVDLQEVDNAINQAQKEIGHSSFTAANNYARGATFSGGDSSFVYGGVTLKVAF